MEPAFTYDPLQLSIDSIRLFQIVPDGEIEEIHCKIDQHPTSNAPPYCAVSYSWGSAKHTKDIILNGQRFPVHENLWSLLTHLKFMNEGRPLWIDAICIDQASIRERNHQVGIMGKIYERSQTVLVWLGQEAEHSEVALEFLAGLPTIAQPMAIAGRGSPGPSFNRPHHQDGSRKQKSAWENADVTTWTALDDLCQRAYWQRTWIIQEVLLAPQIDLLCGAVKISWKSLEHIVNVNLRKQTSMLEPSIAEVVVRITESLPFRLVEQRNRRQAMALSTLIEAYQASLCVDPRDKIYAILSLAADCRSTGALVADYSKDVFQLYVDVMQFCRNITARDRVRFSGLVIRTLHITLGLASAYLSQRYQSGWQPLGSLCRADTPRAGKNQTGVESMLEIRGTQVGYISDAEPARPSTPPIPSPVITDRARQSFFTKLWSNFAIKPADQAKPKQPIHFDNDSLSAHGVQGSDETTAAASPMSIRVQHNSKRRTGLACSTARVGHQIYQFDRSHVAIILSESERGLEVVGEARMDLQSEDDNQFQPASQQQSFLIDALDLLALSRRAAVLGHHHSTTATAASLTTQLQRDVQEFIARPLVTAWSDAVDAQDDARLVRSFSPPTSAFTSW